VVKEKNGIEIRLCVLRALRQTKEVNGKRNYRMRSWQRYSDIYIVIRVITCNECAQDGTT
jgi:hypothetical protein